METADPFPRWPVPLDSCAECAERVSACFQARWSVTGQRVSDLNVVVTGHHPELRARR